MHISSICLANLDVLLVYRREMTIGTKTRLLGTELTKAENYQQQAGAEAQAKYREWAETWGPGDGKTDFSQILPVLDSKKP